VSLDDTGVAIESKPSSSHPESVSSTPRTTPWSIPPKTPASAAGDEHDRLDVTTEDFTTRPLDATGNRTGAAWTASELLAVNPSQPRRRAALALAVLALIAAAGLFFYGRRSEVAGDAHAPEAAPSPAPPQSEAHGTSAAAPDPSISEAPQVASPSAAPADDARITARRRPPPTSNDNTTTSLPTAQPSASSKEQSKRRWGY
jgi:hypothetical protein